MGTQRIHKSFSWPAYVVVFQSLALLPLYVCVVAQCPGSDEDMQPFGQHCSHSDSAGPSSVKTIPMALALCELCCYAKDIVCLLEYHFK